MTRSRLPNAALRERFLAMRDRGEIDAREIAERLDWRDHTGAPASTRVNLALGILAKDGRRRETIHPDDAAAICRALHVLPTEIGL